MVAETADGAVGKGENGRFLTGERKKERAKNGKMR